MRILAVSAIVVLALGCSSEPPPSSQTPEGGPSAEAPMPSAAEPMPSAAPTPEPVASAAPAPDRHELSLERADVKKTVGKMMPALTKCLKKAAKKDPDLKGQTMLTIAIGADGAVTGVTASQTEGLTDKMVKCLESAVKKGKFEAPPAGSATVNLPIEAETK